MNREEMEQLHARSGARPEEVESVLRRNRAALDGTLSELEQRLAPNELLDTVLAQLRGGAGAEYVQNLRDQVARNPLPVTLTAIGLAWTVLGGGNGASRHGGVGERSAGAKEAGSDMARRAGAGVRDTVQSWRRRSGERRAQGAEAAAAAREHGREWTQSASERAAAGMRRGDELVREHPLLTIGAGLAVGAVVAALLPSTRQEDRTLGRARDRALDRATTAMHEEEERLRSAAEDASAAARQEASEQGLDPEAARDAASATLAKAKRVAAAARREAKRAHTEGAAETSNSEKPPSGRR